VVSSEQHSSLVKIMNFKSFSATTWIILFLTLAHIVAVFAYVEVSDSPPLPQETDEGRLETALGVNCINVWTTGNSRIFQCDGGLTCEPMTVDQASPDCVTQP
jgi:hypothetical protein